MIIGIIIANTRDQLALLAAPVITAACLHNLPGLAGGYCLAWLSGCDKRIRRTLAIEVGMQNSGLAIALVELTKFPLPAALPGALFSVWRNISGSLLAAWWGSRSRDKGDEGGSMSRGERKKCFHRPVARFFLTILIWVFIIYPELQDNI